MADQENLKKEIQGLEASIKQQKQELAKLRSSLPKEAVKDYSLLNSKREAISLSSLFGDKSELLMIFNMGKSCPYCTLWADGFAGLAGHLGNRAAFVVVSPDTPEVQKEFSSSRNWNFPMYSHSNSSMAVDLKMKTDEHILPGVITFSKDEAGNIYKHNEAYFGPGDNFCVQWDLMDLLPSGPSNWAPKYSYV